MGNIISSSPLDNYPADFQPIKTVDQKPYGQAKIFKNEKTGNHTAMISVDINETDVQRVLQFRSISSHVIKVLDWCYDESGLTFCAESKRAQLFYEFCPSTLEREIQLVKKRGKRFLEEEVWYVLNSIIQLSSDLSIKGLAHKDLRPCNVLVNEFNVIKFAPVGIFPSDINAYQRWLFLEETTYLAPENFMREIQNIDWKKNDVFAAGLCVLDMMTLDASHSMYKDVSQIHKKISNRLNSLTYIYSSGLIELVKQLLQPSSQRISLQQLNLELKQYQKQIVALQKFTFQFYNQGKQTKGKIIDRSSLSPTSLKYSHQSQLSIRQQQQSIKTQIGPRASYETPFSIYNTQANKIQRSPSNPVDISSNQLYARNLSNADTDRLHNQSPVRPHINSVPYIHINIPAQNISPAQAQIIAMKLNNNNNNNNSIRSQLSPVNSDRNLKKVLSNHTPLVRNSPVPVLKLNLEQSKNSNYYTHAIPLYNPKTSQLNNNMTPQQKNQLQASPFLSSQYNSAQRTRIQIQDTSFKDTSRVAEQIKQRFRVQ